MEHPLQKWFTSDLVQREAALESIPTFSLLGTYKHGNIIVLDVPTVQLTAVPEQRQVLGCFGQNLSSEEALAWPLDTILDCMSDTKQTNLLSPLKTLKVTGNSRCKETSYLGTTLGR